MADHEKSTYITIGKIGATYGIRGWLKIHSFTDFGSSILNYQPWYIRQHEDQPWKPITITDGQPHGKGYIAQLEGVNTPEAAKRYTGCTIAVLRSQLPSLKPGEYYWSDLIGLKVINKAGDLLGHVAYLIETGANDVLVVKADKEYAIPFLKDKVILDVNLEKGFIQVDWELL